MRVRGEIVAVCLLAAACGMIAGFTAGRTVHAAGPTPPIIDAHLHYSQSSWAPYPPEAVFALMDKAGVVRAVASSTPDDGTVSLYKLQPARIVPFLRPYRAGVSSSNWTQDPALPAYLDARLASGIPYQGIGEFHLWGAAEANTPNVKHVVALAVKRGLYLEVHSGAEPVRALFAIDPNVKVLWAHAGMSESPATVATLLEKQPRLWVECSFRAGDIAPGGRLDPEWRALFLRFSDRFLIGTDTYITERLGGYVELIEDHRAWLAQLPAETAAAIANGNATRLLGVAK